MFTNDNIFSQIVPAAGITTLYIVSESAAESQGSIGPTGYTVTPTSVITTAYYDVYISPDIDVTTGRYCDTTRGIFCNTGNSRDMSAKSNVDLSRGQYNRQRKCRILGIINDC